VLQAATLRSIIIKPVVPACSSSNSQAIKSSTLIAVRVVASTTATTGQRFKYYQAKS